MNAVQKLRQMVGELGKTTAPGPAQEAWDLTGRLLSRMPVDAAQAGRICETRDLAGLDAMIARLENPQPAAAPTGSTVSAEEMDRALKAFKKRLKLTRLSEESKLGGRQLTGGRKSEVDAIIPPDEFPAAVWQALAAEGRLKNAGQGFYALA